MSSLPQTTSALSTQHSALRAGVEWLDLKTAAARSGLDEGHLRKLCVRDFMALQQAKQERPSDGGKPIWFVRSDALPSLARVRFPEAIPFDLNSLTDANRRQLLQREKILQDWEQLRKLAPPEQTDAVLTEHYLARLEQQGQKVSPRTLYNWRSDYRAHGRAGLVDARWQRAAKADRKSDPFFAALQAHYLTLRRRSKQVCYELAVEEADRKGWPKPSLRVAKQYLMDLPLDLVTLKRYGESAYVDHCEPYLEGDYSTLATNEFWDSDHHQFDVIVQANGKLVRPWLTAWQDLRSRQIVGYVIRAADPNSDAILLSLRRAVLAAGVPDRVLLDNGKDYDSYTLQGCTKQQRRRFRPELWNDRAGGVFGALGIGVTHAWPYHGQSKPIERFFGTMEDRFGRGWLTYFGNKPENRPEDLSDQVKAGHAPLIEEFAAAFDAWLTNDYAQRPSQADGLDGQSPAQAFATHLARKRTATEEQLHLALQIVSRPITVQQNGVHWNGLNFGQYVPELRQRFRQEVRLRVDPDDVTRVTVWTLDDKFICLAPANRRLPKNCTKEELAAAIKEKRQDRKRLRQDHPARMRMATDETDRIIAARAAENQRQAATEPRTPNPEPPSIRPLRMPFEDQLPAVREAISGQNLRMAVGAEGVSRPAIDLLGASEDLDMPRPQRSSISLASFLGGDE